MIVESNGLQIFWTLYKTSPLPIQISAGWAIRNCLASIEVCLKIGFDFEWKIWFQQNHGELVRSFDGIFYLLLNKLSTDNLDLLSVTLAIIAEIARDQYNLEILTDLGFLSKISQLKQLVVEIIVCFVLFLLACLGKCWDKSIIMQCNCEFIKFKKESAIVQQSSCFINIEELFSTAKSRTFETVNESHPWSFIYSIELCYFTWNWHWFSKEILDLEQFKIKNFHRIY